MTHNCLPSILTLPKTEFLLESRISGKSARPGRRALPAYKFEEMLYTGKRLTAQEWAEHNIVMKACHIDDLMQEVFAFAKPLTKDREIIKKMKAETHQETLGIIEETLSSLS